MPYNKKYYLKNKKKIDKQHKKWNDKNRDKLRKWLREYQREYYQKNKIKLLPAMRISSKKYRGTKKYRIKKNEREKRYHKLYPRIYKTKTINGKQMFLHRWIMEQHIGRKLLPNEIVHHLDHNKLNNNISNLAIMDRIAHSNHHNPKLF